MSEEIKDKSTESTINSSNDYIKDNVFDKFDISDLLNNDLSILKVSLEQFFYQREVQKILNNSQISESTNLEESNDDIFFKINNNNFGIKVDELKLTFKNGYTVPFIDLYTPIDLIGQGAFGIVLSVIDIKKKKKIAAKIISKNEHKEEFYLIEAELLKKLNHEKILKFHDVINTDNYLFIFTDLCEGGSLKDFIISRYNSKDDVLIKDSECSIIIKNLLQGIEYLSQNGVIHRDLKPENIMFKNSNDLNSLVICDLGIAGELKNIFSFIEDKCGTLTFMAPEILMDRPYDNLVDIWSAGIIMYILESGGCHPLLEKPKTKSRYIEDIKSKKQFYFPKEFPLIARNIFLKMCKYEPCFRYDVNKLLNHPWITRENNNIPLTVIDNLLKKDKIITFKEMLITMIFLNMIKNKLNISSIQPRNELLKRKLSIKKNNFEQDLYPSPYNCNLKFEKKISASINGLQVLTRAASKYERKNKNIHTIKLRNFNTAQKHCERHCLNSKNYFSPSPKTYIKRNNFIMRNMSHNKLNNKDSLAKPVYRIENHKKKTINTTNSEIISKNLKTPLSIKKKSLLNIENDNRNLTIKMMRNKENLNINNLINRNIINNYYTDKKSNNRLIYSKIDNRCNFIEPKNLFHNAALKNISSKRKIF